MTDEPSNLHGRDQAIALVHEFMTRPEENGYPRSRRTPIMVFTGPKGCGKSAFLGELKNRLQDNVPYARIDCSSLRSSVAWEVLSFLTFEFNRTAAGYGAIPFPRFVTAQVAIAEKLTPMHDLVEDRDRIKKALERLHRVDKLRDFLAGLAEATARAVPFFGALPGGPEAVRHAPALLLRGLISGRWARRVVLGKGLDFYGAKTDAAYDQLIRLNRLTRDDAPEDDRKEAAEALWAAFLADLRAAFGSGRGARTWSLNCVVLLDNIDTKPGRLLYRALADARRNQLDPLTVVATSAGGVAQHVAADEEMPFAEAATYRDYEQRRTGPYERDSYPVRLRDLTLDEVTTMVSAVGGAWLSARRNVAASVYRVTRGHPAATAILIKAIGDNPKGPASIRELLAARWRGPVDKTPCTVEERMLREFLGTDDDGHLPTDLLTRLEVCAAARDVEQVDELASSGLVVSHGENAALVPPELQVSDPETGRMTMQPALRNLLLCRLARDAGTWQTVHTWLSANGRTADRQYHALAAGDLASVIEWLEHGMSDAEPWFKSLYSITSAPNNLGPATDDADPDRVLAAAGWTGDGARRTLARIVAALWIANDPLSTANRTDLYDSVASDLRDLAQNARAPRNAFRGEAKRLEDKAETVEDLPAGRTARTTAVREPVSGDFPPPLPRRELRRRRVLVGIAALVVVAAATPVGIELVPKLWQCADQVYKYDNECVGVTDGSYAFGDQLADVSRKIFDENDKVRGQPHVTVAMLTPMIPTDVGSVTWQRIRAQLEGAHVAQLAANSGTKEPKVRLMLANPGSNQQEWSRVVDQLVEMVPSEHLVGVIGVGLSTTNTQESARRLAAADLPMVGSVVTATEINAGIEGFTRVNSTTGDQIAVLSNYLAGTNVGKAMLVFDINENDLYTSTLSKEFRAAAGSGRGPQITVESRFDTEASLQTQFGQIIKDLCPDDALNTVLYAGRAVLLDDLITSLRNRPCALHRKITLVTGSDASMLRTRKELRPKDTDRDTSIIYTPHVDPAAARQAGIAEFDVLTAEFERLGFAVEDMQDGWGVMMHDAMLTMTDAVVRSSGLLKGGLPSPQAVRVELGRADRVQNQVRGAGGTFRLNANTGNMTGRRLPIVEVGSNGEFAVRDIREVPAG